MFPKKILFCQTRKMMFICSNKKYFPKSLPGHSVVIDLTIQGYIQKLIHYSIQWSSGANFFFFWRSVFPT